MARYADMWNAIRRPVEELRRKVEILRGHCETVGRDPSAIERTLYLAVAIRDDTGEARRVQAAAIAANGTDEARVERALCGPPALIAERVRPYMEIGFSHFIVDLPSHTMRRRWRG